MPAVTTAPSARAGIASCKGILGFGQSAYVEPANSIRSASDLLHQRQRSHYSFFFAAAGAQNSSDLQLTVAYPQDVAWFQVMLICKLDSGQHLNRLFCRKFILRPLALYLPPRIGASHARNKIFFAIMNRLREIGANQLYGDCACLALRICFVQNRAYVQRKKRRKPSDVVSPKNAFELRQV